jgi:hypothetical protein
MANRAEASKATPTVFVWEPGVPARIGLSATLSSASIGLLLALFQVQGWAMPKALAHALIVLLVAMIAAGFSVIVYEAVRALRRYREHRKTTASWVASEAPGLLDYEADGIRAGNRFTEELEGLNNDTTRLGKKLARHAKRMEKSAGKSAQKKQRLANRSARAIGKSADYLEKRLELLDAIVKDIKRNTEGVIASMALESDEEIAAAKELSEVLKLSHRTTVETVESVSGYAETVRDIEQQNLSRTVRIASRRLGAALEGIARTLERFARSGMLSSAQALDRRIAETEGR